MKIRESIEEVIDTALVSIIVGAVIAAGLTTAYVIFWAYGHRNKGSKK